MELEGPTKDQTKDQMDKKEPGRLDPRTKDILRHMSCAITVTWDYKESKGKTACWRFLLAFLGDSKLFRTFAAQLRLLSCDIQQFTCQHGTVIYTERDHQLNVHIIVPRGSLVDTFVRFKNFAQETFLHHAINMVALKELDVVKDGFIVRRRTLLPMMSLRLEDGEVVSEEELRVSVESIIQDAKQVRMMMSTAHPFTTSRREDPPDKLYWHRFPCGSVATFRNPVRCSTCLLYTSPSPRD